MIEDRCALTIHNDNIAHLRLTRPDARNAIDLAMVESLAGAIDSVSSSSNVRSLLISGEGSAFCVGGDLKYFSERLDTMSREFDKMISVWHSTLKVLSELPFPVVTAIHGGTAGGGLGLVWCADHVIAADDTKMATGFAEIGLSGDGGSSWHLPRLVGLRRAQEMILDNRVLDADTALEWGLINRVVPGNELLAAAWEQARRFSQRSITATRHAKKLLAQSSGSSYETQLRTEHAAMVDCGASNDGREGIRSFIARTPPLFTDR